MRIARPNMSDDDVNFLLKPKIIECVSNETLKIILKSDNKLNLQEIIEKVDLYSKLLVDDNNKNIMNVNEESQFHNVATIQTKKHNSFFSFKNKTINCQKCGSYYYKLVNCKGKAICNFCKKRAL